MLKRLVMVGMAVLFVTSTDAQAVVGPNNCTGQKAKAAGKKAASKLTCLSKSLSKGTFPIDSTCLAKAEVKFSQAAAKAETKVPPACLSTGDTAAIEAKIDTLLSDIDALTPDALNACDSAKAKAAGKKVAAKLTCHSKAVTKGLPLDSTCMAKAEVKFSQAVAKADAKYLAGCTANGNAGTYENLVDAAIDDIIGEYEHECARVVGSIGGGTSAEVPIGSTYQQVSVLGGKLCGPTSPTVAMRFHTCSANADCGGAPSSNQCAQTPWVQIGSLPPQPSGVGSSTTFTLTPGTYPTCEHGACIKCGNPAADCTTIKSGCDDNPGSCLSTQCCDTPGFVLPALSISAFGVCTRTVQIGCGTGVVNTSRPQTGDNEVTKVGDTTDPGADCQYGTGDDPAPIPCGIGPGQTGRDNKGKVARTQGNGSADAAGIHVRITSPSLSTAWSGDTAGCPANATFDAGETLFTQLIINTESTTAGATASFADLSGDACAFSGSGFGSNGAGPVTAPAPPAAPIPYVLGGGDLSVAASTIFSSQSLAGYDVGYIAVTSNGPITQVGDDTCSCTPTPGCPE